MVNTARAKSPVHPTAMCHSSPRHERCRTDASRLWRLGSVCADLLGRWPRLVGTGLLALILGHATIPEPRCHVFTVVVTSLMLRSVPMVLVAVSVAVVLSRRHVKDHR